MEEAAVAVNVPGALGGIASPLLGAPAGVFMSLATSLDLFSIWLILLLAVGFSAAQPRKLTFGKALAGVLIPWGIYVVGKAALATLQR